ncbi:MAG: 3-dehydroquinate synthase [Flavobacteriaceae bacterium]|jgi:3-dehydroquinate synthase|nr:3-dehydroquinate synthase [Flavobacteriaceae bacterium]
MTDRRFSDLNQFLRNLKPSKIFFLCDENTHQHCIPELLQNLETEIPFEILEIEAGETQKTIETATRIWEIFAEFETDRNALLANVGGGVITDLGGFSASTFKRGIKFIHIPTTLLAMCDSSIGGKTGIDLHFFKNIIGTFALPEQIFVYPDFLKTLPFEELRSGFAEMLKHGLIADAEHWEHLISLDEISAENIAPLIEHSGNIKQSIVNQDFKEQNIRKILNFGHSIGHAVESLFLKNETPILHGEAVALGMICETRLAVLENLISEDIGNYIIKNIQKYFPHISITDFSDEQILSLMMNDKKNIGGKINFSLINGIGTCLFNEYCSPENVLSALDFYRNNAAIL